MQLVLSLFPGIDLLGRAFEEIWGPDICVVRGPDVIFGGDIRGWHVPAGKFQGVFGGPPCQCFSALRRLNPKAGERFGNLIPEFERVAGEGFPHWWLMENVPGAPLPSVPGYSAWSCQLDNRQFGETQSRLRRWTFGVKGSRPKVLMIDTVALESRQYVQAVTGSARAVPVKIGGSGKVKRTYTADGKRHGPNNGSRASVVEMLRIQGAPLDMLDDCPFTEQGKRKAIGNGVPMAMGRAIAKAVKEAVFSPEPC